MKLLISSILLISGSAMAAGVYDRDSGLFVRAESYQQLSWCDGNKVVREDANGELALVADCDLQQKKCVEDPLVFNKTLIYRSVCK